MTGKVKRIAVIPGDGIGPEVTAEAVAVLERVRQTHGVALELQHFDWGADKFLKEGVSLPEGALEMLARDFDAVFSGAFGDPRVPSNQHAEDILLGMRRGLDLYINLRPVRLLDARLTPLKGREPLVKQAHGPQVYVEVEPAAHAEQNVFGVLVRRHARVAERA